MGIYFSTWITDTKLESFAQCWVNFHEDTDIDPNEIDKLLNFMIQMKYFFFAKLVVMSGMGAGILARMLYNRCCKMRQYTFFKYLVYVLVILNCFG